MIGLLLVNLHLVAVKVPQLILHAMVQVVLLDLEAALVDSCPAELGKVNLGRCPVRQKIVRLI